MPSPAQFPLVFEPGLVANYKRLEDVVAAVVYAAKGGVDGVAPSVDMSPSELTRRLAAHTAQKEGDEKSNRPLRVADLVGIIEGTGDYRPIFWLIERFLRDPEAQRTQAIQTLAGLMPTIQALVE